MISRLAIVAAAACVLAAVTPAAAGSCKTTHSGACVSNGAACGPPRDHARCETFHHRAWRGVEAGCACKVKTPHGSLVIP